jgi:hypothetical protein
MIRLALHGPMYSGKTRLARELVDTHGFTLVNYTDYLKTLAARSLSSIGITTSVAEIKANKGKYRPYLQDLGTLCGFDEGGFVDQCVQEQAGYMQVSGEGPQLIADNIVFDNVRTQAQFDILKDYGFRLVRLWIPYNLAVERAAEAGVSEAAMAAVANHQIETPLPHQDGELLFAAVGAYPYLADDLVNILEMNQCSAA